MELVVRRVSLLHHCPMILARHVLCAVGDFKSFEKIEEAAKEVGKGFTLDAEYSQLKPDKRMTDAFEACRDRINSSWKSDDAKMVKAHKAVAYVQSPPIKPASAKTISK